MKDLQPWHDILPGIIDRIPNAAKDHPGDYKYLPVSIKQLCVIMTQFKTAYVGGNHDLIEFRCRAKARMLDLSSPPSAKSIEETNWFKTAISGLHRSKKRYEAAEAKKVPTENIFAKAEAAQAAAKAAQPLGSHGHG